MDGGVHVRDRRLRKRRDPFVMYVRCSVYPGGIWIGAVPPRIPEQKMVVAAFSFVGVLHRPRHTSAYSFISAAFTLVEVQKGWNHWAMEAMIFYSHRGLQRTRSRLGGSCYPTTWLMADTVFERDGPDRPLRREPCVFRAYLHHKKEGHQSNCFFCAECKGFCCRTTELES